MPGCLGQILPGKFLKPVIPGLQRPVMQRGMGVGEQGGGAGRPAVEGVILIDVVVNDLALAPQGLHGANRGRRLELGAVVMDVIKGHKSRFQSGYRSFLPSGRSRSVAAPARAGYFFPKGGGLSSARNASGGGQALLSPVFGSRRTRPVWIYSLVMISRMVRSVCFIPSRARTPTLTMVSSGSLARIPSPPLKLLLVLYIS